MATPTPIPLNVGGTVTALNALGLTGVIALGALLFFAGLVYKRFRR